MATTATQTPKPRFCSECGAQLNVGARFCHGCGAAVGVNRTAASPVGGGQAAPSGIGATLRWAVPTAAFLALLVISVIQYTSRAPANDAAPGGMPLNGGVVRAPDISSMSPEERADRLFNRVMTYATEGKSDSATFFAPMALAAISALSPLDAHRRYDMGLVALVAGNNEVAAAQADSILAQRRNHLLGLSLAARAAEARGDRAKTTEFRRRIVAAEKTELAAALPEYKDHDADVAAAITAARAP